MKVLLVDDEPLARLRLRTLLREHPEVEVLAECADGAEASDALAQWRPDAMFLDIRMPQMNGLELARIVGRGRRPLVVLVTAHAEHALEAFECRVVDYLLKPVRPERLAETVGRLRERLTLEAPETGSGPPALPLTTLMVREGESITLVPAQEVEWIEAAGNYLVIHAGAANHVLRATLSDLEARLDPNRFVRISRSVLVNALRVEQLLAVAPGQYEVVLHGGRRVKATRSLRELRACLERGQRPG